VQGGVCAATQEVAMAAGGVVIVPDDLVRIIDADCLGGAGASGGIVEGVEGINWHDMDSLSHKTSAKSVSSARQGDRFLTAIGIAPMSRRRPKCIVRIAGWVGHEFAGHGSF